MMRIMLMSFAFVTLCLGTSVARAQSAEQTQDAKWMLERLTGTKWPAASPLIKQMATLISQGNKAGAAQIATSQPSFINVTVKQMALKISTREETIRAPFSDFTATVMGVVRDGTDARELLTGDFYYRGDVAKAMEQGITLPADMGKDLLQSNRHFEALDGPRADLTKILYRVNGQQLVSNKVNDVYTMVPNPDPAGLLTTRGWIAAHATAGTNRRLVEFTFREFMCLPIEKVADAASSDSRVGRDIDRFPGGDHVKYQTSCKACHTVMDGFRGAFSRWDFDNDLAKYSLLNGMNDARPNAANGVMNKLNQNNRVYAGGFVTTNDSFVNHANRGTNMTLLGWRNPSDRQPAAAGDLMPGAGVNQFGRLIANSTRFSACMAQRVFEAVCRRSPSSSEQETLMKNLGTQFEGTNYNFKRLFELVATHPSCRS